MRGAAASKRIGLVVRRLSLSALVLVASALVPATAGAQGPFAFSGQATFNRPATTEQPTLLVPFDAITFAQPQPGAPLSNTQPITIEGEVRILRGRIKPGTLVRVAALDGAGNQLRSLGSFSARCLAPCSADLSRAKRYAFGPVTGLPSDPNVAKLRAEATVQFQGDTIVTGEVAVGGPPGSAPDLQAGAIEVNQVVAEPDVQSVPFSNPPLRTANLTGPPYIAGKPTLIRVPLQRRGTGPPVFGVDAVLSGTRNGNPLPGSPIRPLSTATAVDSEEGDPETNLVTGGRVLVWRLPGSWAPQGEVQYEVSVNPASLPPAQRVRECTGCVNNGNRYRANVTYVRPPAREVLLRPYRLALENEDGSVERETRALDPLADVGERLLPMSNDGLTFAADGPVVRTDSRECGIQAALIAVQHVASGAAGLPLGVLPPGSGCRLSGNPFTPDDDIEADGVHTQVAGLGVSTAAIDDGGMTLVHELGHAFGLLHASCDHGEEEGGACESFWLAGHGSLDGTGVDPVGGTLVAPGDSATDEHAHDIMSYGPNRWMSSITFDRLRNRFAERVSNGVVSSPKRRPGDDALAAGLGPAPPLEEDRLLVAAEVLPGDVARLGPVVPLDRAPALPLSNAGRYALTAFDAQGAVVAEHRFEPTGQFAHGPGIALATVTFPRASAIRRLVVSKGGTELLRRERTPNDPTVEWTDPANPRPFGASGTRRVSWTAGDRDGDDLRYLVQFSPDGGRTWRALAPAVEGLSYDVDLSTLPSTRRGRFRVVASDGLGGATDVSGETVRVPNHRPRAGIATPAGLTVQAGADVPLLGGATDVDERRPLAGSRLSWSSSRDGAIGRGRALSVAGLSVGTHRITLTARDRRGARGTARVTVRVEPRPSTDRARPRVTRARRLGSGAIVLRVSEPVVGAGPRAFRPVARSVRVSGTTIVVRPARRARRGTRLRVGPPLSDLAGNRLRRTTLRLR